MGPKFPLIAKCILLVSIYTKITLYVILYVNKYILKIPKTQKKVLITEVQAFINTVRLHIGPKSSAGGYFVDLTQNKIKFSHIHFNVSMGINSNLECFNTKKNSNMVCNIEL